MTPSGNLRRIYTDICRGYSESRYRGQTVYVKHLGVFDQAELDELKEKAFDEAVARGIKTEADKLKWLNEKGLWTKKDETDMLAQQSYVENLEKTRGKLAIKVQIQQVDKQLTEARGKLADMTNKRNGLIGLTAEQVSEQKIQHEHIRLSFYSDRSVSRPLFSAPDIRALSDEDSESLLFDYIGIITRFSSDNLRQIAISAFFTNQFYLAERIETFFGKPIVDLTIYQTNLLTYGGYFKNILTNNDLPKEILNNPDKIEDYIMRSRNLKNIVNKAGPGDRVALIGATTEDFKAMGVEDGSDKVRADISRGVKSGIEAAKTREVTQNVR